MSAGAFASAHSAALKQSSSSPPLPTSRPSECRQIEPRATQRCNLNSVDSKHSPSSLYPKTAFSHQDASLPLLLANRYPVALARLTHGPRSTSCVDFTLPHFPPLHSSNYILSTRCACSSHFRLCKPNATASLHTRSVATRGCDALVRSGVPSTAHTS